MATIHTHPFLRVFAIIASLLFASNAHAQADTAKHLLSDQAHIYLVTCSPGQAIYEHYGHTAIVIQDPLMLIDEVYNYGIFDFYAEHFYWHFVKGETYYRLDKQSTPAFVNMYIRTGRQVNVQELNLSHAEKDRIYRALLINYYPENREYLYNFVFDNCATRPYRLFTQALSDGSSTAPDSLIRSSYHGYMGQSYRSFISHYTPKGSWADFGINLLFGPKADMPMNNEQRLFLPEELMLYMHSATFANGTPAISTEQIQPFQIPPIPWYATWYCGLALLFILLTILSIYDRYRHKRTKWVDYTLYCLYAILLAIVTLLTFFSIHPLVGFGPYLLLIPSLHLCARIPYMWH